MTTWVVAVLALSGCQLVFPYSVPPDGPPPDESAGGLPRLLISGETGADQLAVSGGILVWTTADQQGLGDLRTCMLEACSPRSVLSNGSFRTPTLRPNGKVMYVSSAGIDMVGLTDAPTPVRVTESPNGSIGTFVILPGQINYTTANRNFERCNFDDDASCIGNSTMEGPSKLPAPNFQPLAVGPENHVWSAEDGTTTHAIHLNDTAPALEQLILSYPHANTTRMLVARDHLFALASGSNVVSWWRPATPKGTPPESYSMVARPTALINVQNYIYIGDNRGAISRAELGSSSVTAVYQLEDGISSLALDGDTLIAALINNTIWTMPAEPATGL